MKNALASACLAILLFDGHSDQFDQDGDMKDTLLALSVAGILFLLCAIFYFILFPEQTPVELCCVSLVAGPISFLLFGVALFWKFDDLR